jgi:hypothetical protein
MVLVTGWIVMLVLTVSAPAGMVNNSLPSADISVPPAEPMLFDMAVPVGVPTGVIAAVSFPPPIPVPVPLLFGELFFLQDESDKDMINNSQIASCMEVLERRQKPIK